MFQKVLQYAGEYRKKTYAAAVILLIAVFSNVLAYLFVYRIIEPLAAGRALSFHEEALPVAGAAVCLVLHACLYVKGLSVSHDAAYHTLYHLRVSLQKRLEAQPLGSIQDKGVGALKKIFTDDIEAIELLLAHALPEGIANVSVPLFIFIAMFFVDWKLGLLALMALPIGAVAIVMMFRSGMSKMGDYYASSKNMNNTIIEYINGMEVVKVFNRDGESYHRFETDVKNYRDFTLSWFRACWPWMAAYTSILPCIALFLLPLGSILVLRGQSTLADLILVLCMSFGIGTALVRAVGFMSTMPQINYKINALEEALNAPPLCQGTEAFSGNGYSVSFENVHFSYGGDEVLHGISLEAREGGLTAFVGESGSGKSTLAKLLVHFYDVTEGAIRIGGQDIREMSLEALNEQIAFVAQEQFLL